MMQSVIPGLECAEALYKREKIINRRKSVQDRKDELRPKLRELTARAPVWLGMANMVAIAFRRRRNAY